MHIPRHKNIHEPILVVVRPRRPGHEPAPAHPRLFRHILKRAISPPAIQRVPPVPRHKNVQHSVIIKIRHRHAHPPTLARQPRRLRHIFKFHRPAARAIPHLPVQRHHQIPALPVTLHRGSIHHQRRQHPAVVAINKSHAPAHGLHNIFFFGRSDVRHRKPRPRGNILKGWNGRNCPACVCVPPEEEVLLSCAPPAAHKNTNTASATSAMIRFPLEPGPNAQLL